MTAEERADRFMKSGKTMGGGDAGWIRAAFIEGFNEADQEIKELREENEQLMEQNSAAIKDYNDLLVKFKELRKDIEMALGQSKDTTLRSSLIVMIMAETLEQALNKEK